MPKSYQINNLRISYNGRYTRPWMIRTPDGRVWDQFTHLEDAKAYARRTKDFLRRK